MRPGVILHSLGCRLNEAELEEWARGFQARGIALAAPDEPAALAVVNTCAVTEEAVRKSRKLLRRLQREHPGARLVVSGCLATLEAESLAREAGVDLLVANAEKDRLVEIVSAELDLALMPESATEPAGDALFARGRQRAFVKVQDGCRYQCTFCITTRARGAERSRPVPEVVAAIRRLNAAGIREVVLSGVHLGGYGSDLGEAVDLGALIGAILAETDIERLRLGSLEPWDLPANFWALFENPRLMPHLHLPVQSGSERVLRRMARRCRADAFLALADEGRARVAGLNITTDIIAGFPGETDDDWRDTLALAEQVGFGQIHLFAYSPRAGTRAATLPDQLPPEIKRARIAELQALAERSRRALLRAQIGQRVEVLCERAPEGSSATPGAGYTPNYLPVAIQPAPGRPMAPNDLLWLGLQDVDEASGRLIGVLASD
ncbi:MAG: tRNA (N(6)-L-threonylcarbamoyladenosine(37)-C(2))-methylthiotransferase MtaB [Chromatiaceae bacterium]|nr:tRNA (N(6)-L-threonylcarbamoyladenosine(37)-C(2))-methylthiotransferase MtaB [Chromatiaceae bacterium]